MRDQLETGAWLNSERLRTYPILLLSCLLLAGLLLVLTAKGDLDMFGRPLGTDFSEVWIAGVEVDHGHPAQPYDNAAHFAAERAQFGASAGNYVFPYPPYFLALAALLGHLPYLPALALWQISTLALYLGAVFAVLRPARLPVVPALVVALAFPAVSINLWHGQNGFLTAALLTFALLLLAARRELFAGVLFALLAYKPQLALVIPLALAAEGRWRAIAAAAATLVGLTLATLALLGLDAWRGFLASLGFTRTVILEQGALGYEKVQSLFAAIRLLGGAVPLAYLVQAVGTGFAMIALGLIWRSSADARLKAAALLVASLIATPYALDYDMVVLAPALAFAVSYGLQNGFGAYEKSGLFLVWVMPLFARPLGILCLPFGIVVMVGFFLGLLDRARRETAKAQECLRSTTRA